MQSIGKRHFSRYGLITGILFLGHTFALGTETFIPRSQFDTKHLVSLFLELMFFVFSR